MWGRVARNNFFSFRWYLHSLSCWICAWDKGGPLHHRFFECSEQKRLQYGTSTNGQQHGRHQYQTTWRPESQTLDEPYWLMAQRGVWRKNELAGKVNKIAKMIARIVTLEALQPTVTEASDFLREIDQCLLEVEDSNRNWRITITMIIIIGFAAVTFAMWRRWKYFEDRYEALRDFLLWQSESVRAQAEDDMTSKTHAANYVARRSLEHWIDKRSI